MQGGLMVGGFRRGALQQAPLFYFAIQRLIKTKNGPPIFLPKQNFGEPRSKFHSAFSFR
jgi:hypothetical protein